MEWISHLLTGKSQQSSVAYCQSIDHATDEEKATMQRK